MVAPVVSAQITVVAHNALTGVLLACTGHADAGFAIPVTWEAPVILSGIAVLFARAVVRGVVGGRAFVAFIAWVLFAGAGHAEAIVRWTTFLNDNSAIDVATTPLPGRRVLAPTVLLPLEPPLLLYTAIIRAFVGVIAIRVLHALQWQGRHLLAAPDESKDAQRN